MRMFIKTEGRAQNKSQLISRKFVTHCEFAEFIFANLGNIRKNRFRIHFFRNRFFRKNLFHIFYNPFTEWFLYQMGSVWQYDSGTSFVMLFISYGHRLGLKDKVIPKLINFRED